MVVMQKKRDIKKLYNPSKRWGRKMHKPLMEDRLPRNDPRPSSLVQRASRPSRFDQPTVFLAGTEGMNRRPCRISLIIHQKHRLTVCWCGGAERWLLCWAQILKLRISNQSKVEGICAFYSSLFGTRRSTGWHGSWNSDHHPITRSDFKSRQLN